MNSSTAYPSCARRAAVLLVALALHAVAHAASVDTPLGIADAIAMTLESNPALRALGYQIDTQQARVQQAGLAPNPELNLTVENALGSGGYDSFDSVETTLGITWAIERGARQRRLDAARAGASLAVVEADVHRLDATAETARRFVACLAGQARLSNAERAVRFAHDNIDAVHARVEAGRAPQAELARARAELARIELTREDIEHELLSARHRLAAQWGETQPRFTRVSGDLLPLPDVPSFADLEQRLRQNPDLTRFLSQQRVDEAMLRLAEAERRPDWRLSAGVRHLEASGDQALVAGFSMPLVVRNRNEGNVAEARARLAATDADAEAARVQIKTSLFVIHQELEHARHRAGILGDEVIPRLEEALAGMRDGYERGRYSYFEWRSVQSEWLTARNDLLEAGVDARLRVIEIERLTGTPVAPRVTSH